MDFLNTLSSISKVGIAAAIITLIFLIREFYLFKVEQKKKEKISSLPIFNPNQQVQMNSSAIVNLPTTPLKKNRLKSSTVILSFTTIIMTIGIIFISIRLMQQKQSPAVLKTKAVEQISPAPTTTTNLTVLPSPTPKSKFVDMPSVPTQPPPISPTKVPTPTTFATLSLPTQEPTQIKSLPKTGSYQYSSLLIASAFFMIFISLVF